MVQPVRVSNSVASVQRLGEIKLCCLPSLQKVENTAAASTHGENTRQA